MRGCFQFLSSFVVFVIVLFLMAVLSLTNLVFSNAFGETCGILHPYIFQVDVSSINTQTGSKALTYSDPSIPLSSNDEELDTYLRVYDTSYQLLAENDDFVPENDETAVSRNSLIPDFPIGQFGTVIVEVGTYGDSGTGYYRLNLEDGSRRIVQAESFEISIDGQNFSEAQSLSGTLPVGERRSYEVSGLQDINIRLSGIAPDSLELDTYLRVYDAEGNLIAENDDGGESLSSALFAFPLSAYETIRIEVGTYGDGGTGEYELVLESTDNFVFANGDSMQTFSYLRFLDGGNLSIGQFSERLIRSNERVQYWVTTEDESQTLTIRVMQTKPERLLGFPTRLFGDSFTAIGWSSCVEYYGYIGENGYQLNQRGYERYAYDLGCFSEEEQSCQVLARIKLTLMGQLLLYVITPGLVILLPIAAVYSVRTYRHRPSAWRSFQWIMMLALVALHVLTTSLLYVHLSTVSNIEALANFAYGILAGAATGSAIAFMDRVLDVFGGQDDE